MTEASVEALPLLIQKQPPELSYKNNVFSQLLQNLQENTCVGASISIKLQAWSNRCFSVNFAKKSIFFIEHFRATVSTNIYLVSLISDFVILIL